MHNETGPTEKGNMCFNIYHVPVENSQSVKDHCYTSHGSSHGYCDLNFLSLNSTL